MCIHIYVKLSNQLAQNAKEENQKMGESRKLATNLTSLVLLEITMVMIQMVLSI
jgi:hypothetical protein